MTKKKRIIRMICFALLLLLILIWALCNAHISNNTRNMTTSIYESASGLGGYNYFILNMGYGSIISEDDYRAIAAGSSGIWKDMPEQCLWNWDIRSAHTLFYGTGASTYLHDRCTITDADGTVRAGYDRHIRLDWRWTPESRHNRVINTYEYITPEFPCNVFDMFDSLFS